MTMETGQVTAPADSIAPAKRGRQAKSDPLEERVAELETRLGETIDVLAGISKAGGWLKRQFQSGERA